MADIYILIVDDKPQNLFTLEKTLASVPAKIISAASGEEALSLTLNYDFSLAILDVQMPGMDGYELASYLLGDPSNARIPIIFLSAAYSDEQHSFKGYETGAVDYIVKPFEPAVLLRKVHVFLELARYRIQLEQLVKERTRMLEEKEKKLRFIMDNTPDCIVNIGLDGMISFINSPPAYLSLMGQPVASIFHSAGLLKQKSAMESALRNKQMIEFEAPLNVPWYGEKISFAHRLIPIVKSGEVTGFIQISRDLSQLKLAEQAREKMMRAEAENQAKSKFLANMSHEIRTPLNAILGYAQLLKRAENLTSEQYKYLEVVDSSGAHLLGLIDSILDMAKIESGRMTLSPVKTSLLQMLREIEQMFSLQATKKSLRLKSQIGTDLPEWVYADINKIRQILINLIGNAIKFTDAGLIEIRAGVKEIKDDQAVLFIEVIDTGCGIEKEKMHLIFKAFEQAEPGKRHDGVGLGLAVSNEFARLMGGKLEVTSELGHGSTFHFEFVAHLVDQIEVENKKTVSRLLTTDSPPKVLIVDDDADNLKMLDVLLQSVGFDVALANNGEMALALFESYVPHLILMDIKMEGLSGIDVIEQIRQSSEHHDVPIILITASPLPEFIDQAQNLNVTEFLVKPFREQSLFQAMERLLAVQFDYYADKQDQEILICSAPLTATRLQEVSQTLRDSLKQAVMTGYMEKIDDCVAAIGQEHSEIGRQLQDWMHDFKFSDLLKLLDSQERENGE